MRHPPAMPSAASLRRLLHALEELGRREDGALAGGDGLAFLELEQRAAPLALRIASLADEPMDPDLRERGQALVLNRRERHNRLMVLLETTRDEIGLLDEARMRARNLRPTYAAPAHRPRVSPSFNACG
jgi:hypothetical protein